MHQATVSINKEGEARTAVKLAINFIDKKGTRGPRIQTSRVPPSHTLPIISYTELH